ncbi:uncharacterized protein LOC129910267 isoform X4 [Episyrphus balteatus]|uniref:uncharacterized protein LOC129910267 isoform X4 n=1 Tax=Episyrphus balteatus TaxID=286459 RepID=UPI0024860C64|nr:uncharacterized protein LOC129910267 isoform X4 [Episyrphus balteatus]
MPWNCLCSSDKERHKLEISAPILNRDGSAKIIQNTKNDGNSKKTNFPHFQRNTNQSVEIVSNSNFIDDNKLYIKFASKQQRQQRSRNNARNTKDANAKLQTSEQQSSNPAYTLNFVNKTIDLNGNASLNQNQRHETEEDDTTYSQLVFERHQVNKSNETSSGNILSSNNLRNPPTTVTSVTASHRHDFDSTGHYDRLPFDKSLGSNENSSFQRTNANHIDQQPQVPHNHDHPHYQQNNQNVSTTGGFSIPNGVGEDDSNTIPFIDEEDVVSIVDKHGTHLQINEGNNNCSTTSRIIPLHSKNVGSNQTIERGKLLHRMQLSNGPLRKLPSSKGSTSPLSNQNPTQNASGGGSVHNFQAWNPAKGKLCQVCHESASNGSNTLVKCRCCDLVCHHWCVPKIMPSVRYHDTSFIIYRKWLRAEDELAFPTIHKYVLTSVKAEDKITKPDYYLTDSECTYSNQMEKRIDLDAVNRNKRKSRRRTRSLEKRKPTTPNAVDNVTAGFIATKSNAIKDDNDELSLRASENKISIRVEANDDDARVHQHQSLSGKLRIVEAEKRSTQSTVDVGAGAVPAETSDDESDDDFGSKGSCYDAIVADQGIESQRNQSQRDLIAVDVHSEPRPQSGFQRSSKLIIREPTDLKETKESVPVISDKDNVRNIVMERQISCTSDESASESYSLGDSPSYAAIGRGSSLRSSLRSATSASSSNYFLSDRASDVGDMSVFESRSTLQKPNEDRVDSNQQILPKLETQPWSTQTLPAPSQHQKKVSTPGLRLHYVTERILAYILPTQNGNYFDEHDQYEKEVIPMLEQKHGHNYQLFNLETCISVITLERICELCKHIDKWLGSGQEKVVVLQDREDCQRLGATLIAFLEYLRICASNYQTRHINLNEDAQVQNTIARNWMNLDMFSMKKFLEGNIEPLRIPSYKRYIRYFSGLLSGQIKLNASPLHLNSIGIESPPSFLQYNGVSSKSEWSSFIKIYEGLQCVYTSDVHIIPITTRQFLYQIGNLRLRGDILIRCYQIGSSGNIYDLESKKLMFSVQFHTCAIKTDDVVFVKEDLDCAHDEPQFPNDCKVSFHFNSGNNNNFLFQSPLIRTERLNDINKANSIENLDLNSCHTQGPLDGSLYATILKSPKSSHCPNNNNDQSIKSIASFDKSFDSINNNKPIRTSTPIKNSSRTEVTSGRTSFREASAPLPARTHNNTQIENRPGTSQSNYRQQSGQQTSTLLHHQTNSAIVVQTPDSNNRISQNGSREFVRSPLTLSMDSGISSSGVLNKDRHRELDDILSDMLLTVQDIPDFQNRKSSTHSINQYDRSQSVVSHVSATASASSPVYTLPIQNPPAQNINRDLIHSSHSYVSQENVQRHSNSNSYNKQDRFDPYDTASTTTTLTPPPSESGRDTPNLFSGYHSSTSNTSRQQQQQRRETNAAATMPLQHNQMPPQSTSGSASVGQKNSQHQSATYHRVVRTSKENNPITSEDEDNIPYHAREHSQPFSYGNLPSNGVHLNDVSGPENQQKDPRMIKAQSGLTSPMLVRKTFGGTVSNDSTYSTLRKPDFEEMLRERREKVMSEKYSISDKQPVASNGYHNYYNDPLKRSNTLDGFHRSTSTNELSGQTWLQLQQQKLRAKKNAQLKDDRKYFEEIHTEIKNRPLRLRNNARYDGYASDTAAFDEVDFRRPLHVQTPYHTSNSSPERHYHTISTTTKTVTKERPFVAVKRSHETAKQEKLGSPSLSPLAILNASPLGHIAHAQQSNNIRNSNSNINNTSSNKNQNGLLSLAESPMSNGRARLESDNQTNNVQTNSLNAASAKACAISCNNNLNSDVSVVNNNNNHANITNSTINEIHLKINDNKTIIDYNSTDTSNNNNINHKQNICYNSKNYKMPPYHANNIEISSNHIHHKESTNFENTSAAQNGQSALEELLATLAVETDLMNQQLIQNKQEKHIVNDVNENGNIPTNHSEELHSNNQKANQELSDVIADLAEFTRFENQRLANGYGDSLSNNSSDSSNCSNVNNLQKRLLSESDQSSSISPSPSDRSNHLALWHEQVREESFSSYRSETDQDLSIAGSPRPETPAFPVTPRTPYGLHNGNISPGIPPRSPTPQRRLYNSTWSLRSIKSTTSTLDRSVTFQQKNSKDIYGGTQKGLFQEVSNQNDTIYRTRMNSNASNANSEPQEVAPHLVKFVRDSSKFWYKPNLSREEAIDLLRNATPGTFIVRDSTTFKNAYGLVVRVAQPPPGVTASPGSDELVRHFLVEPTTRGVRLKGCANEPVFSSLSALVYQHSITQLALPCRLLIPDSDIQQVNMHTPAQKQLLTQGAACNVLYLYSCGTESLTGEEAVRRAVAQLFSTVPLPKPTEVHFKVAQQGITLTDNTRQKFFRKHYTAHNISFCGTDPEHRQWSVRTEDEGLTVSKKTIFAFVARRSPSSKDNQCHVFCDLAITQPATAIVSFANKVLPTEQQPNRNI